MLILTWLLTNLSNMAECRLCKVNDSVESPIHIFLECVAMAATRQGLFNDPFPTQQQHRLTVAFSLGDTSMIFLKPIRIKEFSFRQSIF